MNTAAMAASGLSARTLPVEIGVEARKVLTNFARVFGDEAVLIAAGFAKISPAELDAMQKYLSGENISPA